MLNSTNIKTWISDLRAVSGAVRAADMSVAAIGAVDYAKALDGLSLKQAQLMLTTQGIVGEEQKDLLVKQGLIAISDRMSASLVSEALANNGLNKEKIEEILIDANLMSQNTKELITENAVTEAKLRAILAEKGIKGAKADTLIASVLQTGQNSKEALSWKVLGASAKEAMVAMLHNPLTWVIAGIASIGLLIKGYDTVIGKQEKLSRTKIEGLDEDISKLDEEIRSLEELQSKLEDAKGSRYELSQIQTELNDAIGETQGLLNGESKAWDVANAKLKANIELKKQQRKQAQQDKVNESKVLYDNNAIEIDWHTDKSGEKAREYAKALGSMETYTDGKTDWESYLKFIESDDYKNLSQKVKTALGDAMTFKTTYDTEWAEYLKEQAETALSVFDETISNYDGAGGQEFIKGLISDMAQDGASLSEISDVVTQVIKNQDIQDAINKYWESLVNPDINPEESLQAVKKIFDDIVAKNPALKDFFDNFYNGIVAGGKAATDTSSDVNKMTVSLEDLSKELDKLQDIYKTVSSAISEFNNTGYLSVDSFQALMELDAKYIPMLIDEQGNLTLTKEALNDLTAARMEEMAIKQAQALIDSVSSLGTEAEQMSFLRGQVDQTTNSFKEFAEAQALALLASGKISTDVYNELIVKLNAIGTTLENAKQGLKNGGWDSKNLENVKKKAEKAKELAEKEKEIQEDLAKKEKEIQEDLAEKEKQFAENMAEAMKKEHLEQLKDDLNKQKDLIDRFHKAVELTDFAIGYIDDDNFQLKSDLLAGKMNNLTTYGKSMREEFDRICQIIPQTGEEAEALASRIEQLGSDMRSNISDIRETQVAIQTLRIDAFQSIADNSMAELEKELDNIDRRLELLNVDNKNDYKYTNELLSMNSLLPVYSDFNKTRKEKSKQDKQKIEDEQKTQDKINEVVSNALKMQAEDNAKAREKERKKLIEDMEKARKDAMEKLEEARKDAQKKLQEARKNYQDFLNGIKSDTTATLTTVADLYKNTTFKVNPIDLTEYKQSIEELKKLTNDAASLNLANAMSKGTDVVDTAQKYLGVPYVLGGTTSKGFDCSGFVQQVFSEVGKSLPRTTQEQVKQGRAINKEDLRPGDLVFFYSSNNKNDVSHVGIYVGDDTIIHAASGEKSKKVKYEKLSNMSNYYGARRFDRWAKGTKFHPGGLALLGDENLLNSKNKPAPETVIYPNGKVEIVGENGAEFRDLPRGTEVLNNTDTKKLFNNIPRYENGTSPLQNFIDLHKEAQTPVPVTVEGDVSVENASNSIYDNENVKKALGLGIKTTETIIERAESIEKEKNQELADIDFMLDEFSSGIGKLTVDTRLKQQEIMNDKTLSDDDKQKALVDLAIETKNGAGEFAVQYSGKVNEWFTKYLKRVQENPELYSEEIIEKYQSLLSDTTDWVYDFENDIVQKKQKLVESTQNKVSDIDDYIETRDFYNDWSLWNDSKEDSMLRQIGEWKKLLDDGYISVEEYNKQIQDIEKNLYTIKKDKLVEALELNLSKMKSLQSITQSYFDTTNSIAEAQHNITKELEASKTMTEYLDEGTRKLLFNQDDYNKLTKTLTNIQREANQLQKEFNKKIRHASAEEMDALTSEYQMQYDILMKKYEISKADLEIEKKRTQLNNVLNERNVRMRINGKWQYVANTQDVINAQNELSEAEYQKTQASTSLSQTREINNMTLAQDKTTTIINQINKGLVDFDKDVSKFKSGINDLHTKSVPAFGTMISNCCASLKQFKRGLDGIETPISTSDNYDYSSGAQKGVSSVGLKSNQLTYTLKDRDTKANRQFYILPYDKNIDYANLIDNAKTLDEALNYNNYRNSKIRDAKGGEDYENEKQWDSNYVKDRWLANRKKYAKGTRKTHTETALMGEDGHETFISSNGHLIPINQPTFGNIEAGGIVFNRDQMDFVRKIWDWSNVGTLPTSSISNFINRNSGETVNYNMYGDAVFNGDNPEAMWKGMSGYMKHTRYKSN